MSEQYSSQNAQEQKIKLEININYADSINEILQDCEGECSFALSKFVRSNYQEIIVQIIAKSKNYYREKLDTQSDNKAKREFLAKFPVDHDYLKNRVLYILPRLIKSLINISKKIDQQGIDPTLLITSDEVLQFFLERNLHGDIRSVGKQIFNSFLINIEDRHTEVNLFHNNYINRLGQYSLPQLVRSFATVYTRVNQNNSYKTVALKAFYKVTLNSKDIFLPELILKDKSQFIKSIINQTLHSKVNREVLNSLLEEFVKWLWITLTVELKTKG